MLTRDDLVLDESGFEGDGLGYELELETEILEIEDRVVVLFDVGFDAEGVEGGEVGYARGYGGYAG